MRPPAMLAAFSLTCACATAPDAQSGHAPAVSTHRVGAPESRSARRFSASGEGWLLTDAVHGWDARFDHEGVAIGNDAFTLALVGYGRDEDSAPLPRAAPTCDAGVTASGTDAGCAGPVRFDRGDVEEWWVPVTGGVQQGWTLLAPPPGEGAVALLLDTSAPAMVDEGGTGATFAAHERIVRYAGLSAWDADGAPLAAWLEATETGLRVRVDDEGAAYPLTVDPFVSTPDVLTTSSPTGVAGGGDFNGDGYDDVAISSTGTGTISVYHGGSGGISTTASATVGSGLLGAMTLSVPGGGTGRYRGGVGDVQGDGYDDLVLASRDALSGRGRIMLCSGSATGLQAPCAEVGRGNTPTTGLGAELSGVGDINGDGRADFAASDLTGTVYVYRGSRWGATLQTSFTPASRAVTGHSVGPAGDVNGDGYDDLAVGQQAYDGGLGAVSVYWGSAAGISSGSVQLINYPWGSLYSSWCASYSGSMGWAVSTADFNGDGYGDVVASAPWDLENCGGYVYLFLGSAAGAVTSPWVEGSGDGWGGVAGYIGYTLAGRSDFNGDGYDDIGLGGESFGLFEGMASPPLSTTAAEDRMYVTVVASPSTVFGSMVRTRRAGDVDGDGYDDALVSFGGGAGVEVNVYYGSP